MNRSKINQFCMVQNKKGRQLLADDPLNLNRGDDLGIVLGLKYANYNATQSESKAFVVSSTHKETYMGQRRPRQPSTPITPEVAAKIKALAFKGLYQHDIASEIGCNQGRISEVMTGKVHPEVAPEASI